jgi:DNA polymerase I-like protein with 3'-5' exonuclease and polymerase domains
VKLVQFNPGSRHHIADRLMKIHKWEPTEFAPEGGVKIDETILGELTYPEAPLLATYFGVTKMLGQVSDGKGAYLKCVKKDGRIHGSVNPCGAVTGRMTHSSPNVSQADKDHRVRALFTASKNRKLVGTDADSLELRCLAHFLAKYDGGEYIAVVLSGNKDAGTDMHTRNMKSMELIERECAKRIFYAWLYGAGDYKLGLIIYSEDWDDAKRKRFNSAFSGDARKARLARIGGKARANLVKGINGAEELIGAVKNAARRGYLRGLDGRRVHCRSQHAALNTLLQSAGALVMKKALTIADAEYRDAGLIHGGDFGYAGNIHDEFQIDSKEEHAEFIGTVAAEAIRVAGEHFKFRCPLAGNYAVGDNWADTH